MQGAQERRIHALRYRPTEVLLIGSDGMPEPRKRG